MRGDRVEVVVELGGGETRTYDIVATRAGRRVETTTGRGVVEVTEVTRTGEVVRTARFMQARVIAVVSTRPTTATCRCSRPNSSSSGTVRGLVPFRADHPASQETTVTEAVIVAAARTPIGRARKGSLVGVDAFQLAEVAVGAALERSASAPTTSTTSCSPSRSRAAA